MYLDRIEAYDKQGASINSLITINQQGLSRARELDQAFGWPRASSGPPHGIPVIVKDNYDTADLPTTNGILALTGRRRTRISRASAPHRGSRVAMVSRRSTRPATWVAR